ncbi:MAG: DUF4920 domain-containing protein [Phycisphaerae bacterium]|nr:DUF4920 domain-containing protein [Phycisphaerae bacterium]MDW8261679.1 DUF4920 domain-containing protein [Phycisphaerales bacterium]
MIGRRTLTLFFLVPLTATGCVHVVSHSAPCCQKSKADTKVVKAESKAVYASFGTAIDPSAPATPAGKLLADLKSFEGKPVRVSGVISKVCQRKGCWLQISEGGRELFVKFTCPIEGKLIPSEAVGKEAIVEGQLAIKEISEEDARHIAEEAGKSEAEVNAIVGPQRQVTLNSPGAIVFGVPQPQ